MGWLPRSPRRRCRPWRAIAAVAPAPGGAPPRRHRGARGQARCCRPAPAQQPGRQILQIGQSLAQVGIGDAAHPVPQLAGDAHHRGLRGQAAGDGIADPASPSLHRRQPGALPPAPRAIPRCRACRARSDGPGRDASPPGRGPAASARLPGPAPGSAVAPCRGRCPRSGRSPDPAPATPLRTAAGSVALSASSAISPAPAAGQGLGQQHGHRLHHVHLIRGVAARRAVLHHQHTHDVPAATHWDRQQRGEQFLAGFRTIGRRPGGSARPAGSAHARWRRRCQQCLPPTRRRVRPTESGRRPWVAISSSTSPGAHGVERANLGHHLGGDDANHLG